MLLVKQGLARLVPEWVTHGSCSGADVGLARFTTLVYYIGGSVFDELTGDYIALPLKGKLVTL